MSFNSETWEWFKTAPLPVVLAISLTLFVGLAGYVRAVEESAKKHETEEKAAVAVAAEQAKTAAEIAKNMDGKLDRLLVAVLEIQAQHKAEEKAKKEKK